MNILYGKTALMLNIRHASSSLGVACQAVTRITIVRTDTVKYKQIFSNNT